MKKLTRRQAWRKIQKAFRAYTPKLATHGFCYAVRLLVRLGEIDWATALKMERDIRTMRPDEAGAAYYWPTRRRDGGQEARDGAKARVKAITKLLKKKS